jgi:nucleoside-diphosphate-sugar epimerase
MIPTNVTSSAPVIKVGILGHHGFLGSNIMANLHSHNIHRVAIEYSRDSPDTFSEAIADSGLTHLVMAIGRASSMGARSLGSKDFSVFLDAIWSAKELLSHLSGVIWFGSGAEFGGGSRRISGHGLKVPRTEYALAKSLESSALSSLRSYGVPVQIIYPSTVFGAKQRGSMLYPQIVQAVRDHKTLNVREPMAVRDFVHVSDLAELVRASITAPVFSASDFICARGNSNQVGDFVRIAIQEIGERLVVTVPANENPFAYSEEHFDIFGTKNQFAWAPAASLEEQVAATLRAEGLT